MEDNRQENLENTEQLRLIEGAPQVPPRIYVASLSDYNAGRLHGVWLEASADIEEMETGVQAMLAASEEPEAEEWAIHDYEGFGPLHLSEYEGLSNIAALTTGMAEHGPAFVHWVALKGGPIEADEMERFEDAYLGHAESLEAYAEELLEDMGVLRQIEELLPDHLQTYVKFDVEGFARDLELSGDVGTSQAGNGIYVFSVVM
jgi:antirestriction protein